MLVHWRFSSLNALQCGYICGNISLIIGFSSVATTTFDLQPLGVTHYPTVRQEKVITERKNQTTLKERGLFILADKEIILVKSVDYCWPLSPLSHGLVHTVLPAPDGFAASLQW